MPLQSPYIQSVFKVTKGDTGSAQSTKPGDGFTHQEVDAVLKPIIDDSWLPSEEYEDTDIVSLVPGPHCVAIQGRIANLYDQSTPSKRPKAAKGCAKMILKDDSGALTVCIDLNVTFYALILLMMHKFLP
jgi:hypothetical protein